MSNGRSEPLRAKELWAYRGVSVSKLVEYVRVRRADFSDYNSGLLDFPLHILKNYAGSVLLVDAHYLKACMFGLWKNDLSIESIEWLRVLHRDKSAGTVGFYFEVSE